MTGGGRLLPTRRSGAARTPFVVLVVVLLASGLIGLLVLNSAVNQDSFKLSRLQRDTTRLTDEEQALQQDVDEFSDPRELAHRAGKLGMVPGGNPAFLTPDGRLHGIPGTATATPAPGVTPESARTRPARPAAQPPPASARPASARPASRTPAPGTPTSATPAPATPAPGTPAPGAHAPGPGHQESP